MSTLKQELLLAYEPSGAWQSISFTYLPIYARMPSSCNYAFATKEVMFLFTTFLLHIIPVFKTAIQESSLCLRNACLVERLTLRMKSLGC